MKTCSTCKEAKELIKFGKDKSHKSGLANECKQCRNLRNQGYRILIGGAYKFHLNYVEYIRALRQLPHD